MWKCKDVAYNFCWHYWLSSYQGWFWHQQKTTRSEGQLMYKIIEENDIWALEPHTYLSPGSVIISCKRLFWLGANELTCPVPRALISNCSHKIDNCKHMVLHIAGMHKAHEQRTWTTNEIMKHEQYTLGYHSSPCAHQQLIPHLGWDGPVTLP